MSAETEGVAAAAASEAAELAEAAKAAKAKILEGVDFIETEEDAEAVESAVVKIQSTFRGKKIRSKLNKQTPSPANNEAAAEIQSRPTETGASRKTDETGGGGGGTKNQRDEEELKRGVATMQDLLANLPEDEVERAATKIQAGFKGYRTRKELEGNKLAGISSGGHQMAPQQEAATTDNK